MDKPGPQENMTVKHTVIALIRHPKQDINTKDIALVDAKYQYEAQRVYKELVAPAVVKSFLEVYQSTDAEAYLWGRLHGQVVKLD